MTQCPALALVALLGTASIASGCYLSHSIGAASDAGAADARAADARAPDAPGVDAARVDAGLSDAPAVDGYVASMCERVSPDEWILPVAVRGGDFTTQVPIGMRFRAGGCSCTPRPYEEEAVVGAELCDCCFDCDCIAPSYEATVVRNEPAGLGSYTPIAPNGARGPTIVIVDWGVSCAPISEAADVVEIVIPDGTATPARPVGTPSS